LQGSGHYTWDRGAGRRPPLCACAFVRRRRARAREAPGTKFPLGGEGDDALQSATALVPFFIQQAVRLAGGWCWFVLREKYWWLGCSERKVLLSGG
jgi:hypothetical protein